MKDSMEIYYRVIKPLLPFVPDGKRRSVEQSEQAIRSLIDFIIGMMQQNDANISEIKELVKKLEV